MNIRTIEIAVILIALVVAFTGIVSATPIGADGTKGANVTRTTFAATTHVAGGGNITPIDLSAMQQTEHWQGYYGNVNSVITLDDADGNTMYNWTNTNTTGEVYATLRDLTPLWSSYGGSMNLVSADSNFYLVSEPDSIENTFTKNSSTGFTMGDTNFPSNSCPTVKTDGGTEGDAAWETVLLHNGEWEVFDWIFVGIINETQPSFLAQDGGEETCDYQMIVPINCDPFGQHHTYYFYVEIT
ncbi:MAG: hypothetical protein U9N36_09300 [Euryarchaeota archaeon]|nr:hypothetical protein [Euryarchaeota archaeon]